MVVVLSLAAGLSAQPYTPTTIYLLQQDTYPVGTDVYVDSVVVTAVDSKATTYGFHAQELPGGPWSGILCYLSYTLPTVEIGDMVEVWGYYDLYNNHSEIQVDSVKIIEAGYGEPDCELMSIADLGYGEYDSTFAEKWEGVLLCVDTVQVINHGDYGEWTVEEYHAHPGAGPGDSLRIDDKLIDPTMAQPDIGDTLAKITGVYAEEYTNYRVWPRDTDDLVFMGPTPGPNMVEAFATRDTVVRAFFDRDLLKSSAEDESNYYLESATTINQAILDGGNPRMVHLYTDPMVPTVLDSLVACGVYSAEGYPMDGCDKSGFMAGITSISYIQTPAHVGTDSSQIEGERVTVRGVATGSSSSFGGPFFLRDASGPWNCIYAYYPAGGITVGDSVIVSGYVDEYYNWTEISGVDYVWKINSGNAVTPDIVTPAVLGDSATSESYESALVMMDSVKVFTGPDGNGEWTCGTTPDTVAVGDFSIAAGPGYEYPGVNTHIDITGCYRWNQAEYKIEPRDSADIVVVHCAGVVEGKGMTLRLAQNAPNPFARGTTIRFTVPSKMKAKVAVYDVTGRLVKTLADGMAEAGENVATWDARDSHGSVVSSGVYFVQLTTPKGSLRNKMMVIK
jgi:hypothetical protein